MGQGQSDEGKIKGAFLLPGKEPDFNTCKHLTSGNSFMILRLVLYHGSKRQNKRVVFWRQWEGTTPPPPRKPLAIVGPGIWSRGPHLWQAVWESRLPTAPHPSPKPMPEAGSGSSPVRSRAPGKLGI